MSAAILRRLLESRDPDPAEAMPLALPVRTAAVADRPAEDEAGRVRDLGLCGAFAAASGRTTRAALTRRVEGALAAAGSRTLTEPGDRRHRDRRARALGPGGAGHRRVPRGPPPRPAPAPRLR